MIKAVIFDLDNTLIDFMKFKRVCCEEAIEAMINAGLKIPKQKGMEELYKLYSKHGLEDHLIFQKFLMKTSGNVDYPKLANAINAYRKARMSVMSPYPGTKKTLIKLKEMGLKLAIVSDAPKLKAWLRLTAMSIEDFFDVVVALEDTGRLKPSTLPFKAALKNLNFKPDECLMVGDMPNKDMKGAKKFGMITCFAKYGYEKEAKKNWNYEINSITELLDVVNKENQLI
jgi:HAD superfamily hydrolase (TIGR02253 family)